VNCLKGRLDSLFGNDKYCENGEESEWIYIRNDCNSIQDEWIVYRQLHALWTVTDDDDDEYPAANNKINTCKKKQNEQCEDIKGRDRP